MRTETRGRFGKGPSSIGLREVISFASSSISATSAALSRNRQHVEVSGRRPRWTGCPLVSVNKELVVQAFQKLCGAILRQTEMGGSLCIDLIDDHGTHGSDDLLGPSQDQLFGSLHVHLDNVYAPHPCSLQDIVQGSRRNVFATTVRGRVFAQRIADRIRSVMQPGRALLVRKCRLESQNIR